MTRLDSMLRLATPCFQWRRSECFGNAPAAAKSHKDGRNLYIEKRRPLGDCSALSLKLKDMVSSLIRALLGIRGPSAILRRVVSVCIESINGIATRWARPHVGKEGGEAFDPSIAHADTTAAVVLEIWNVLVKAPTFHGGPCAMLWAVAHSMRSASRKVRFAGETSATACNSEPQRYSANVSTNTTGAKTDPCCRAVNVVWRALNDSEAPKCFTSHRSDVRHRLIVADMAHSLG